MIVVLITGPRLDLASVEGVAKVNVLNLQALNTFKFIILLANYALLNAEAVMNTDSVMISALLASVEMLSSPL